MTAIHKTPSRKRYEQRNPVFSVRMPKEWHDALNLYMQKTNRSRKEFMGFALKQITENYENVYQKGFNNGKTEGDTGKEQARKEGYDQGKKEWRIWINCSNKCGNPLYIRPRTKEHEYIRNLTAGWLCHSYCPDYD